MVAVLIYTVLIVSFGDQVTSLGSNSRKLYNIPTWKLPAMESVPSHLYISIQVLAFTAWTSWWQHSIWLALTQAWASYSAKRVWHFPIDRVQLAQLIRIMIYALRALSSNPAESSESTQPAHLLGLKTSLVETELQLLLYAIAMFSCCHGTVQNQSRSLQNSISVIGKIIFLVYFFACYNNAFQSRRIAAEATPWILWYILYPPNCTVSKGYLQQFNWSFCCLDILECIYLNRKHKGNLFRYGSCTSFRQSRLTFTVKTNFLPDLIDRLVDSPSLRQAISTSKARTPCNVQLAELLSPPFLPSFLPPPYHTTVSRSRFAKLSYSKWFKHRNHPSISFCVWLPASDSSSSFSSHAPDKQRFPLLRTKHLSMGWF